jgi:hypothetical protein
VSAAKYAWCSKRSNALALQRIVDMVRQSGMVETLSISGLAKVVKEQIFGVLSHA